MGAKRASRVPPIYTNNYGGYRSLNDNGFKPFSSNRWPLSTGSEADKKTYVSGEEAAIKIKGVTSKNGTRPVMVPDLTLELKSCYIQYEAVSRTKAKGVVYDMKGNKIDEVDGKVKNGKIQVDLKDVKKYNYVDLGFGRIEINNKFYSIYVPPFDKNGSNNNFEKDG